MDDDGVSRATEVVAAAAVLVGGPWGVTWGKAGAFPSLARARVLWLGLDDAASTVRAHGLLVKGLLAAHLLLEDRPYRPHLTLARLRSDLSHQRADELREALVAVPPPPACQARSLVLYRSRLGRGPATYEELSVAPLG